MRNIFWTENSCLSDIVLRGQMPGWTLFRSGANRFDKTVSSWKGWNLLAFHVIFLKHINRLKSQDDLIVKLCTIYPSIVALLS